MPHAQQPTCTNIRIRSTQDTHKIFYAVQKGLLKMVTRRLDADERLALRSGCVYAWEERGPHSEVTGLGIERFTEGRRWTPSRVRDEFLFYYERYMQPPDSNNDSGAGSEGKPPRDWEPMVKQTYSVWVDTANGKRKWHLTAYFTQGTIDQLGTVDDLPGLADLIVPDGLFKSTRVNKRPKHDDGRSDVAKSSVTRTYAAFPSPYPTKPPSQSENAGPSSQPVLMYDPYQNTPHAKYQNNAAQSPDLAHPEKVSFLGRNSQSKSPQSCSPAQTSPTILPNQQPQYTGERISLHQAPSPTSTLYPIGPGTPGQERHSSPSDYRTHFADQPVGSPTHDYGLRDNFSLPGPEWEVSGVSHQQPYGYHHTTAELHPNHNNNNNSNKGSMQLATGYNIYPIAQSTKYAPGAGGGGGGGGNGALSLPIQIQPQTTSSAALPLPTAMFDGRTGLIHPLPIPANCYEAVDMGALAPPPPPSSSSSPPTGSSPQNLSELSSGNFPRKQRALIPLHTLNRQHPYRRDQIDDRALRLLQLSATPTPL